MRGQKNCPFQFNLKKEEEFFVHRNTKYIYNHNKQENPKFGFLDKDGSQNNAEKTTHKSVMQFTYSNFCWQLIFMTH